MNLVAIRSIFEDAIYLYKKYLREILMVSLVTVLYYVVISKISLLQQSTFLPSFFVEPVIALIGTFPYFIPPAILVWYIDRREKHQKVKLIQACKKVFPRLLTIIAVCIMQYVAIFVGLMLFIIPGIFIAILLSQAFYFVLFEGKNPMQAFLASKDLTKGNRVTIFIIGFCTIAAYGFFILLGSQFAVRNVLEAAHIVFPGSFTLFILPFALWRFLKKSQTP